MDEYQNTSEKSTHYLNTPEFKSVLASGIPAFCMRPILQPLDVLKIRFQLQHQNLTHRMNFEPVVRGEPYKSIFHAVKVIYTEEGFRALFRGLMFFQCANTFSSILQFGIYRKLRKELHNSSLGSKKECCDFFAGFSTGAATAVIMSPCDCIRTLLLARGKDNKVGVVHIAKSVYRRGVAHFFDGALTAVWHAGTLNGLRFMFYNIGCRCAMNYEGVRTHRELRPLELFFAGFGAGAAANIFAYPIDFIKRRMILDKAFRSNEIAALEQTSKANSDICRAIIQCVSTTMRAEGAAAFYKGFVPNATKSIIASSILLSCYDLIYSVLENFFNEFDR